MRYSRDCEDNVYGEGCIAMSKASFLIVNYVRCNGNDLNENGGEGPVERKKKHEEAYEVIVTGTVGNYEMVGERSRGRFPHPPFRLANPFPRRPYPYSFQNNPEY